MINVLMVGSDKSVKGGITSVIQQLIGYKWTNIDVNMKFIPTFINGGDIKKSLFFFKGYLKIMWLFITNNIDIVHMHMSFNGSFYRKYLIHKICKKFKIKNVVHLHGSEFEKFYNNSTDSTKKKIRKLLSECSSFVVLGENLKAAIKKIEPSTNVYILNNSVHIPSELVSYSMPFKFLFLGVFFERKGLYDLVEAVEKLSSEGKINENKVQFLLAGSGPEEEKLRAKIADKKLEDFFDFVGWVSSDKKYNLLKESQAMILPSYHEGLPIAILEAISYGMPIISTNVGSINEAVIIDKTGFLIEPGDTISLANAIYKLLSSKGLWVTYSHNAKKLATSKFDENIMFSNLKGIYKNLLFYDKQFTKLK